MARPEVNEPLEWLFDRLVFELGDGLDVAADFERGELDIIDTGDLTTWTLRFIEVSSSPSKARERAAEAEFLASAFKALPNPQPCRRRGR